MDALTIIRALGALGLLLGVLTGALWAVRRYDIRLPGAVVRQADRRLELVERLGIDQRRSVVLLRRDDREHLVIFSPEGQVVVESHPCRAPQADAPTAPASAPLPADRREGRTLPKSFTALLDWNLSVSGPHDPSDLRASKRKS